MSIFTLIVSISPDSIKLILILGAASIVLAGPLVYRVLSGEKFSWFRDPDRKRPDENEWDQLRDKSDQIIEGKGEFDANEICNLISKMQIEIQYYKRKKGTIEHENDCERISKLSQKLQDMDLRVEPFDSFTEYLKEDGLIIEAQKIHTIVHSPSNNSLRQTKKEFLAELKIIQQEHWNILSHDTKTAWKQSVKFLKHNPYMSIYCPVALIAIGLGFRFYHSIVEDKGYEFYIKHPVWIVVFALIIGLPALILAIKYVVWKYSVAERQV